jgi:hypothetical protein
MVELLAQLILKHTSCCMVQQNNSNLSLYKNVNLTKSRNNGLIFHVQFVNSFWDPFWTIKCDKSIVQNAKCLVCLTKITNFYFQSFLAKMWASQMHCMRTISKKINEWH